MEYFQGNLTTSNLYLHLGASVNSVPGLTIALTESLFLGRWEGRSGETGNFGEIVWKSERKKFEGLASFPYETLAKFWYCEDGFPGYLQNKLHKYTNSFKKKYIYIRVKSLSVFIRLTYILILKFFKEHYKKGKLQARII